MTLKELLDDMPCELCDYTGRHQGKRREDNLYVCQYCDIWYPIKEEKSNG